MYTYVRTVRASSIQHAREVARLYTSFKLTMPTQTKVSCCRTLGPVCTTKRVAPAVRRRGTAVLPGCGWCSRHKLRIYDMYNMIIIDEIPGPKPFMALGVQLVSGERLFATRSLQIMSCNPTPERAERHGQPQTLRTTYVPLTPNP